MPYTLSGNSFLVAGHYPLTFEGFETVTPPTGGTYDVWQDDPFNTGGLQLAGVADWLERLRAEQRPGTAGVRCGHGGRTTARSRQRRQNYRMTGAITNPGRVAALLGHWDRTTM